MSGKKRGREGVKSKWWWWWRRPGLKPVSSDSRTRLLLLRLFRKCRLRESQLFAVAARAEPLDALRACSDAVHSIYRCVMVEGTVKWGRYTRAECAQRNAISRGAVRSCSIGEKRSERRGSLLPFLTLRFPPPIRCNLSPGVFLDSWLSLTEVRLLGAAGSPYDVNVLSGACCPLTYVYAVPCVFDLRICAPFLSEAPAMKVTRVPKALAYNATLMIVVRLRRGRYFPQVVVRLSRGR